MATVDEAVGVCEGPEGKRLDISPVLADPSLFVQACEDIYQMFEREVFDVVISSKTSGTVFASVLAARMKKGLAVAACTATGRKGYVTGEYDGEHGKICLGMPEGIVRAGTKTVVVVDRLSQGKDVKKIADLVEGQGGIVIKMASFAEITESGARTLLRGYPLESRVYSEDY